MEEGSERVNGFETFEREEIHSKAIRAGKRTYFLDVKATKRNDYYLTVTESKKRQGKDGKFYYEKHKIFLYKEDFEKFVDGLNEMIDFIKTANPTVIHDTAVEDEELSNDYATVEFEDLETKN
jgi:hypothetical protein